MTERTRFKIYLWGMSLLTAAVALFIFYLAETFNTVYYWGMFSLLPFAIVWWMLYRKMKFAEAMAELRSHWGQAVKKEREMQSLKKAFSLFPVEEGGQYAISPQTWDDLHMDRIYALADRTLTSPGEQVLYNMFRAPLLEKEVLQKRNAAVRALSEDAVLREKLQGILLPLDRMKPDTVTNFLWGDDFKSTDLGIVPNLLAFAALLALMSVSVWGIHSVIIGVIPMFGINYYYQNYTARHLMFRFPPIRYLRAMLVSAQEMGRIQHSDFTSYSAPLRKNAAAGKGIIHKARTMGFAAMDSLGVYEYVNNLFLLDLRNYYGVMQEVKANLTQLRQTYQLLGEVDALIAVASMRAGTENWCEPEFLEGQTAVYTQDIRHPLLDKAVPNSILLEKPGAILTGSNMSGKSTFLRTIGVNALLAQSVGICFARSYKGSLFKIITSINKEDHLPGGKSYYLIEAEAILKMIRGVGSGAPALCIIDEIFRGTHSLERIPAAIEVLLYLSGQNTMNLIATHDLDVARACSPVYPLYHFRERVGESGLEFDYLLKQGITTSWNAIKILRHMGFPLEVTDGAQSRIDRDAR
ncbi:MutS-related protein [Dethiobacter alkaliphilus]|uniref:MutS-related protein n=1 Tax=Dethiobacter alkaliphilus TaxID=427926 RepID=UPI0022261854|nr:hypothetical protein [Dethiobacter alkaliphilus]MCW3491001.1 hypothetical protein [Dethiobacter alkaliphilus]